MIDINVCVFVRVSLKGVYKWRRRWSYQGLSVLVRAEQLPLACGDVGWSPWQPWLRRGGLALLAEVCRQRWHDGLHVFEVECIIQVSVKKRQAVTPIKDVKQNLKKLFFFFLISKCLDDHLSSSGFEWPAVLNLGHLRTPVDIFSTISLRISETCVLRR